MNYYKISVTYHPTRRRIIVAEANSKVRDLYEKVMQKGKPLSVYFHFKEPTQREIEQAAGQRLLVREEKTAVPDPLTI